MDPSNYNQYGSGYQLRDYPMTPQNQLRSRSPMPYTGYSPVSDGQSYQNSYSHSQSHSQRSAGRFKSPPPTHHTSRQSSTTYADSGRSRGEYTSPYSNSAQNNPQTFTVPNIGSSQPSRNEFHMPAPKANAAYSNTSFVSSHHSASVAEDIVREEFAAEDSKPMMVQHQQEVQHHQSTEEKVLEDADAFLNRVATALSVKVWLHWANPKFFHERARFSFEHPCSYQPPYRRYDSDQFARVIHRHLDYFHRGYRGRNDDQSLDPLDGRVRKIFVQTTNQIYDEPNDTTWRRTYIRNVSPRLLRLAWWPYSGAPLAQASRSTGHGLRAKFESRTAAWTREHWTRVGLCWLPACIGLLFMMISPDDIGGQVRNLGNYDPVPYKFWSYPRSARNYFENFGVVPQSRSNRINDLRVSDRYLLPRYLCFVDFETQHPRGRLEPAEWIRQKGPGTQPPAYIFLSYTGEGQFGRLCKNARAQIKSDPSYICSCKTCSTSRADADALHKAGRAAARKYGVPAYWTDQCCMSSKSDEFSADIYGISDVVRNSMKIVVVVGRSGADRLPSGTTTQTLLKEWGTRMWTWPEVLLGPLGKEVTVFTRGLEGYAPQDYTKLQFAYQVWDDAVVARQLLDHYENSLTLSRLELVVLALESLKRRVVHGTTKFAEGDLSYALMGLLRQRPQVDLKDTAFQAFARLSLANDSDRLLERLVCLLPAFDNDPFDQFENGTGDRNTSALKAADRSQPFDSQEEKIRHYWTNFSDYWGAKLWDVEPIIQIAGISDQDTVIIDGAFGATVHWDQFQRVAIVTKETWSRMIGRTLVRGTPVWFFVGVVFGVLGGGQASILTAFAVILLLFSIPLVLLSPILILHIYSGKVWNAQPWLFGIEGHMELSHIEKKIFGFPCDRLSWAPYSSSLSRHHVKTDFLPDECEGTDPLLAPEAAPHPNDTVDETSGEKLRLFSIVDTHTMTVSTFKAVRPPVVALICGSEGGMQRTVMCSYDWTTQTLHRETVLRMETRMLERMPRIGRVRFGLKRWDQLKQKRS